MQSAECVSFLRGYEFLSEWSDEQLHRLVTRVVIRRFAKDQIVYEEGSPNISSMFMIKDGEFEVRFT